MVMWGVGEDEMKGRHGLLTTTINVKNPCQCDRTEVALVGNTICLPWRCSCMKNHGKLCNHYDL